MQAIPTASIATLAGFSVCLLALAGCKLERAAPDATGTPQIGREVAAPQGTDTSSGATGRLDPVGRAAVERDSGQQAVKDPGTGDRVLLGRDTLAVQGVSAARVRRSPEGPPIVTPADLRDLTSRRLLLPVAGIGADKLADTFAERRGAGGVRAHGALDILAPRGTRVLSADDGRVVKVHTSRAGGLTVYAADPTGRFVYFYAHLDGYRTGLAEGDRLRRGDVIGYVGTTGNAPPNTPHLHFAITRVNDADRGWWQGTAIDPLPILGGTSAKDRP